MSMYTERSISFGIIVPVKPLVLPKEREFREEREREKRPASSSKAKTLLCVAPGAAVDSSPHSVFAMGTLSAPRSIMQDY